LVETTSLGNTLALGPHLGDTEPGITRPAVEQQIRHQVETLRIGIEQSIQAIWDDTPAP
jgi:hypothetical protein